MDTGFRLNPDIDADALAERFRRTGRVEIPDFLPPASAERLREHLVGRRDWKLVLNAGDTVYEMPREAVEGLSQAQRSELDRRVTDAARHGFHYRYETIRVPDEPTTQAPGAELLEGFVRFMSAPRTLAVLGRITGLAGLDFADGQATAYSPGHFLTAHDDDVAGKHRRAAYVLGLTRRWRPEWGGLLMFHHADGHIEEIFAPSMGSLRLFAVPVRHSVSFVTPFAPEPRLSVTGWLRSRPPGHQSTV